MKYLLIYWAFSVIYESINFYFIQKSFKKKVLYTDNILLMKSVLEQSANYRSLKHKIWNPYTIIFIFVPLLIIISPFMLPYSLFFHIKKITGYKTELEKKADAETKRMEEIKKWNEEFMKNEKLGEEPPPLE